MKKLFTFFALVALCQSSHSQNIIPDPNDSAVVSGNVSDEFDPFDVHIHVINNTGAATTFTWGMTSHVSPNPVWEFKLCDNNNCYDLLLSTSYHESLNVNAGDTMDMKFQFSPHCISGTGIANVVIYATDDSAGTSIPLYYQANLTTSCLNNVVTINKNSLKISPNPVKSSFIVSGLENAGNYSFEVYDLKGSIVTSEVRSATHSQIEISVTGLPVGDYILKAFDRNGNVAGTSRLSKVD